MKKMANGGMGGMPGMANKGGAMRGQERAEKVKAMAKGQGQMYADGGKVGCGHRGAQDYGKKK